LNHIPRKRFGQNFLHDLYVIERIVAAIAPKPDQHLVEIGPGQCAITQLLVKACRQLDVIEIDRDLAPQVAVRCGHPANLHVHQADALTFDFCALRQTNLLRLVGNLPYNISTPLLFHLLEQADCISDMHVMLQKEVVARMAAAPGTADYGRLTVAIQARCQVEPLFTIGPGAFHPAPKVDSALVRLIPDSTKIQQIHNPAVLNKVLTHAFGMRRKTLRNALKPVADDSILIACDIDPSARAERIPVDRFVALSNRLAINKQQEITS
jgi:16S rRNA (adenine1518-N6/adenine1519-N6)-dimethyltransferase